ncbi:hypothetical protein AAIS08_14060 [Stenotrophomonas bentonitica]|uniref:hypothetical protein n=1 Tax=Stenotrophomonas sp. BIO128-Bstrain TaxID=3027225 RepID=UPI00192ABB3F|nr:hypothetical protein [Stenotrophomonas sp. BIO128-Bstrain]WIA62527.1 hypothetical protein POS15_04695 [Stenotrophomonas sp. BIO128-Bstrain]
MCRSPLCAGLVAGLGLLASPGAHADKGYYPNLGMDYNAVMQYDVSRTEGSGVTSPRNTTDFYPDIQSSFYIRFSPNDQLRLSTEFNPVNPPAAGEKRTFGDLGLVVNELNYYKLTQHTQLQIGKLQVPFGRAMDAAPGLYTNDFVAAYDLGGMLGATYAYRWFGQKVGMIEGGLNLYTADTTELSRPFLRSGARAQRSDGGPANTGKLDSYAVTVNWDAMPALPFLEMQAGYMRNRAGVAQPNSGPADDEVIRIVSARYIWAPDSSADLDTTLRFRYFDIVPLVEYADVQNENAIADNDTRYLTTSVTVDYGRWVFGATRTDKRRPWAAGAGRHDYLNEVSCGYRVTGQLSIGLSIGSQAVGGREANLVGMALSYNGAH